MKTWTIKNFAGQWPVGTAAVVTAETVEVAIILLEKELARIGLPQIIKPEKLMPMVTNARHVRILLNGEY